MAAEALDAYLELVPDQSTMRVRIIGESKDSKEGGADAYGGIQIKSFTFGNASAITAAAKDRDEDEDDDDKKGTGKTKKAKAPPAGKKTGKKSQDYRFQITKSLEASSPHLMTAFFASSNKEKRPEHNNFSEARVVVRKVGSKDTRPQTYLMITFGQVSVMGYKLETEGEEPPTETVDFSFQTCEMKYRTQFEDGSLGYPVVRSWDFRVHQNQPS
ncbi:MAG: type VI secretion system tube protein Hcp [Planctomycetota bacterium]|nr:type VI secretion system tube protein Hcp [Planctomycetota bacterium]